MKIADLFVNIGLSGADKTLRTFANIKGGLGQLVSGSLEAKAALLALAYGFEKLTGLSSVGNDLYTFGKLTGLSTKELQNWQYAAEQVGGSAEEMSGLIKGVQSAMLDMKLGRGAPEGFATMMDMVGFDQSRIDDQFYVMSKIEEFIKKAPAGYSNALVKSLGVSEKMLVTLKMMDRSKDRPPKDLIFSKAEERRSHEIFKSWRQFWYELQLIGAKTVASEQFGKFFGGIKETTFDMINFARAVNEATGGWAAFGVAGSAAVGLIWKALGPLGVLITETVFVFEQLKNLYKGDEMFSGLVSKDSVKKFKDWVSTPTDWMLDTLEGLNQGGGNQPFGTQSVLPSVRMPAQGNKQVTNSQSVTINVDGAESPKMVSDEVVKKINEAARKMPAIMGSY